MPVYVTFQPIVHHLSVHFTSNFSFVAMSSFDTLPPSGKFDEIPNGNGLMISWPSVPDNKDWQTAGIQSDFSHGLRHQTSDNNLWVWLAAALLSSFGEIIAEKVGDNGEPWEVPQNNTSWMKTSVGQHSAHTLTQIKWAIGVFRSMILTLIWECSGRPVCVISLYEFEFL